MDRPGGMDGGEWRRWIDRGGGDGVVGESGGWRDGGLNCCGAKSCRCGH